MVQGGENLSLTLEAGHALGVGGKGLRQDFQRHLAPELGVRCAINFAHTARADHGGNPIMRERAADQIPPMSQAVASFELV